jgi:hypothetical protein
LTRHHVLFGVQLPAQTVISHHIPVTALLKTLYDDIFFVIFMDDECDNCETSILTSIISTAGHYTSREFNIHGSVHRNNILLYKSQQDAHVTEFILSDNCSTCCGRYYNPSSGAQTTVTTASGNRYTVLLSAAIVE